LDKVVIVAGPTASGKSTLAFQLAQERNGAILNGDSLQVYRGLEILTAQPPLEEQRVIPHGLYGFLALHEACSAGKWLSLILSKIQKALKEGRLPIVVGGTGFYLKALVEGLAPLPAIQPTLRQSLLAEERSQDSLYSELQRVDPQLAVGINPHDKQRTLRGLEVFYGTGKPLSYWQSQRGAPLPYKFDKILLMPPKEELDTRIAKRLDTMLIKGVLQEVSKALEHPLSSNAMKAIGLKEFGAYIHGGCSLEEAKEMVFLHTRQYAKRQRTWFRHQFKADFTGVKAEDLMKTFIFTSKE